MLVCLKNECIHQHKQHFTGEDGTQSENDGMEHVIHTSHTYILKYRHNIAEVLFQILFDTTAEPHSPEFIL